MGIVHVLTGPDHLSALATLSANESKCRAFLYGVRWGLGHSMGLIVVGSTFIIISNNNDEFIIVPEKMESFASVFVGIFMVAFGSYSLLANLYNNKKRKCTETKEEESNHTMKNLDCNDSSLATSLPTIFFSDKRNSNNDNKSYQILVNNNEYLSHTELENEKSQTSSLHSDEECLSFPVATNYGSVVSLDHKNNNYHDGILVHNDHHHGVEGSHSHVHLPKNYHDDDNFIKKQFLSVCIGIVHGVAGPGGVLGVIPAVQLHNLWLSIVYLTSFCVTSTLVMGCFAASYGMCSSRLSRQSDVVAYRIKMFSAFLSLFVGFLILILLYMGILDKIFP
eukprot:CAMPEP_0194135600 /NCGR_PEP_ID=MMETSP0152-20130528/5704_1 /TAXON_ID=1049557 /ORGANISM="Thalassiothrix antarctica, Strain L6-D1" /LENGTH=335 /DNA_ID=CAMNT_0038831919 /DNA_START=90 /DNA_END=1097 /DNA_ORIENTATION=-